MCTGNESSLLDCSSGEDIGSHNCNHSEDAGVRCEGKISTAKVLKRKPLHWFIFLATCKEGSLRLTLEGDIVDSVYLAEEEIDDHYFIKDELARGRIEVCIRGRYGTICDSNWDDEDASVVCSQLGFSPYG